MAVEFEIEGQRVMGLNAGPRHKFTEAFSFFVGCDTQDADRRPVGPSSSPAADGPDQCGWLKDQFGLSWQIVPKSLGSMLGDPDPVRASG